MPKSESIFRILTVDDDETILDLYYQIFASCKDWVDEPKEIPAFEVHQSRQGDQAVDLIREGKTGDKPFAVAFLDINMPPGPDGVWAAREIRKIDLDIGIVLVTGQSRINILETARAVLPVDKLLYLQKPFYAQEIFQFASALSEKWRVEREYRFILKDLENRVEARTLSLSKANQKLATENQARTRAEIALRASEKNFRQMIVNNSDGIVILDKSGMARFVNPAGEKILGANGKDFIGCRFDYPIRSEKTLEVEIPNSGPSSLIAELRSAETEWEGEKALLVSIRDISERKRMERDIVQSLDRVQRSMVGTIEAMANIVERRDPYTAGHQQRVAKLSRAIALEMDLPEDQIEGIFMAALIHDIGKISIPAEILSKPGKLLEAEFQLIKIHPQTGYDILKGIEFPWPIAEITLQHHERLDGSGYPRNLAGEQIMVEARIMSVADTVEAMATHRPYRPALGVERALEEISANRGRLYDMGVVEACNHIFTGKQFQF